MDPGGTVRRSFLCMPDATTVHAYTIVFTRALGGQEARIKASKPDLYDALAGGFEGAQKPCLVVDGDTLVVSALRESSDATGVGGSQADNSTPYSGTVHAFR